MALFYMLFIDYYNEIIQPNIILIMFISKYQLYVINYSIY